MEVFRQTAVGDNGKSRTSKTNILEKLLKTGNQKIQNTVYTKKIRSAESVL